MPIYRARLRSLGFSEIIRFSHHHKTLSWKRTQGNKFKCIFQKYNKFNSFLSYCKKMYMIHTSDKFVINGESGKLFKTQINQSFDFSTVISRAPHREMVLLGLYEQKLYKLEFWNYCQPYIIGGRLDLEFTFCTKQFSFSVEIFVILNNKYSLQKETKTSLKLFWKCCWLETLIHEMMPPTTMMFRMALDTMAMRRCP